MIVNTVFSKQEERKPSEKLSPGQVFDLVLAEGKVEPQPDNDLVDVSAKGPKSDASETEVFEGGQPITEPMEGMPKISVEKSQAVTPAEQPLAAEEVAAGVPPEVVKAEQQVENVVEAVPAVVEEEKAEAAEKQEPPTDTAGNKPAEEVRNNFVKASGDGDVAAAEEVEAVWDPLEES